MLEDVALRYQEAVRSAFAQAEAGTSKLTEEVLRMEGMSGTKTRHFYNNLCAMPDARYLEIGTWKGSSLCAAMCGNAAQCVCIDNWSQFAGPKEEFLQNLEKHKGLNRVTFVEADCFAIDVSTLPKFNLYMYDGDHACESHRKALTHYLPCLDEVFVYIVDDWNAAQVRAGTRQAIADLGLEVSHERELRLTQDDTHTPIDEARARSSSEVASSMVDDDPRDNARIKLVPASACSRRSKEAFSFVTGADCARRGRSVVVCKDPNALILLNLVSVSERARL